MIKFWATLLVVSTWLISPFAYADDRVDTVVKHESFLKRQEQRRNELASDPQKTCETKLAEVIRFPGAASVADDPDAVALAMAVKAEIHSQFNSSAPPVSITVQPGLSDLGYATYTPAPAAAPASRDPFFGLGRSLQLLGETADRPMNDAILRLKIAALKKVELRLYKRTFGAKPQPFWNDELTQYCRLLTLAAQGIFYGHQVDENPIAQVTAFFKQQQQHLPKHEKLHLVGALLRGVDLEEAIQADEDFIVLVDLWFNNRSFQSSSTNIVIQRKINEVAKQDDRFRNYVASMQ